MGRTWRCSARTCYWLGVSARQLAIECWRGRVRKGACKAPLRKRVKRPTAELARRALKCLKRESDGDVSPAGVTGAYDM